MNNRELDELVAEHVFNRKPGVDFWDLPEHNWQPGGEHDSCNYAEDIGYGEFQHCFQDVEVCSRCEETKCAAQHNHTGREIPARCARFPASWHLDLRLAWLVVEEMRRRGFVVRLSTEGQADTEPAWFVNFWHRPPHELPSGYARSDSLPRAICLAALTALGAEIPT